MVLFVSNTGCVDRSLEQVAKPPSFHGLVLILLLIFFCCKINSGKTSLVPRPTLLLLLFICCNQLLLLFEFNHCVGGWGVTFFCPQDAFWTGPKIQPFNHALFTPVFHFSPFRHLPFTYITPRKEGSAFPLLVDLQNRMYHHGPCTIYSTIPPNKRRIHARTK